MMSKNSPRITMNFQSKAINCVQKFLEYFKDPFETPK